MQVSANSPGFNEAVIAFNLLQKEIKELSMTPQEELYSKFYNHEKILVKDMNDVQLREHYEELQKIAYEAKARQISAGDEIRERGAKNKAGKEWLVTTDTSVDHKEAINTVKVRAARLTKMDKLRTQLLSAGIDEDTVKEMVKNLEGKVKESQVKSITFNSSKPKTVTPKPKAIESKPVDWNSIFGK